MPRMPSTDLIIDDEEHYDIEKADLTDREKRFVMEYSLYPKPSVAAEKAGYAHPGSSATKLLKKPKIVQAIGRAQAIMVKNLGLDSEEVLFQLWCCLTRSLDDFTDETGRLQTDVRKLSPRARNAVDGIKQKITVKHLDDGTTIETIENELKLVPKATILQLAMQHKGLFAPDKIQEIKSLDWDDLLKDNSNTEEVDPIEERINKA